MPRKTTEAAATTMSEAGKTTTRRVTKRITSKKTVSAIAPTVLSWEHIAERAYYIHLEAGGEPLENWLRAERELEAA
jgi:hypothetical protein